MQYHATVVIMVIIVNKVNGRSYGYDKRLRVLFFCILYQFTGVSYIRLGL